MLNIYLPVFKILSSSLEDPEITSGRMGGRPKGPSEILEDRIHAVRINPLDGPSKSSGEIANGLVLPLEDGFQGADVSLGRIEHMY